MEEDRGVLLDLAGLQELVEDQHVVEEGPEPLPGLGILEHPADLGF